jgi:hypothetical protein
MSRVAVGDHSRARVLYRLPEQRRLGAGGLPGMLTMTLLALVLFLGGLLVGRATRETAAGPPAAAPATSAATATPGATTPDATTPDAAATSQAQAGGATGATAEGVGPRRVEHGVPVGYQHSEQGAVAAAANYAKVLSSTLILDQASRRQAIDTIAAPEARGRLQRAFDQDVALLAKGLGVTAGSADAGTVLLRAVPVGWRVEKYSRDRATVAIWITSVGGSLGDPPRGMPVREVWGTTTVELRWVDGDWKQLDTSTADGPVPIADAATPTEASRLIPQAQEFKEFTYAPGP